MAVRDLQPVETRQDPGQQRDKVMARVPNHKGEPLVRRCGQALLERLGNGGVGPAERGFSGNAARDNQAGKAGHAVAQLVQEARHSDTRRPGYNDAAGRPLSAAQECPGKLGQLAFPAHERHTRSIRGEQSCADPILGTMAGALVHPDNSLNELSGEAWLYFTKSLWTTAYPSELGHAARKAHGANKPPRLMARLIEFFTKGGELVLDPFAGVGGTLLGASICRRPRRAIGFEIDQRWIEVYDGVVRDALGARDGLGLELVDLGPSDPGGPRSFDPAGARMVNGDSLALLPEIVSHSIDFVATDPPYNPQLKITMAGGRLAEKFANRRTDYAMVTEHAGDLANSGTYAEYLDRMQAIFNELQRVLRPGRYATVIVRDAYQDGRYRFTGSDLSARAEAVGLVPKGDLIWYQAGSRLRPYGYPRSFVPNIVHQHILVLRAE